MFGISNKQFDIIKAYDIEHNEVKYPMPKFIVPFAPDGGGGVTIVLIFLITIK